MPIFRVERPSRRQPTDDTDDYTVPEHLADYYAQAPGLTEQQKLAYYRNPPKEAVLHQDLPGSGDDIKPMTDVPLELVEHRTRLRKADSAYRADQYRHTLAATLDVACDLCGTSQPAFRLAQVDVGSRTLRLCAGDCRDTIAHELHRRRWTDRITELLDD